MKHSSIIIIIVCLAQVALVSGCNEEKTTLAEKRLVVEGWIDSGEFPVVKLTRTMPLGVDHKVDIDKLSDYMERWAKVTISDGERSEVMVVCAVALSPLSVSTVMVYVLPTSPRISYEV